MPVTGQQQGFAIPQPEGPGSPELVVPARLERVFNDLAYPHELKDSPESRFLGAILIANQDHKGLIAEHWIRTGADNLAQADSRIREAGAGTPILIMSRGTMDAGITAPESGIYFMNGTVDPELDTTPLGMVKTAMRVTADISSMDGSVDLYEPVHRERTKVTDRTTNFGAGEYHLLTGANLEDAEKIKIAENFDDGVFIIGESAIAAFFEYAVRPSWRDRNPKAERLQRTALEARDIIQGFRFY